MAENPKFEKIIERPDFSSTRVLFDKSTADVEYKSKWEDVPGGVGVKCRTWDLMDGDGCVDGADIIIEAGGYTPIQYVNVADVVVDTPESGEAYCVVMDLDGEVHVEHFDGSNTDQMVWTKGMIITWIAVSEVELTEFSKPSFHDDMFLTIPDDTEEYEGHNLSEFHRKVRELRQLVDSERV